MLKKRFLLRVVPVVISMGLASPLWAGLKSMPFKVVKFGVTKTASGGAKVAGAGAKTAAKTTASVATSAATRMAVKTAIK